MQIGEADGERIVIGKLLVERDADIFGVVPGESLAMSDLRSFQGAAHGGVHHVLGELHA